MVLNERSARPAAGDLQAVARVFGEGVGVGGGDEGDKEVLDGGEELVGGIWLVFGDVGMFGMFGMFGMCVPSRMGGAYIFDFVSAGQGFLCVT